MGVVRAAIGAAMAGSSLFASAASAADLLILSAFPTEQAVLLAAAAPVTEAGTFNGRRFFRGAIAGRSVVLGLTGIGLLNADATTRSVLDSIDVDGIVYSGVAGGDRNIGDVMIPDRWTDGTGTYAVDKHMLAVAEELPGDVAMDSCLPIEDATCTGLRTGERTPFCIADGAEPQIYVGGLGSTSDPFGGRAVPCLSHAGNLIGCEACGAPVNRSPGVGEFLSDAAPFADPAFYLGLIESFTPGPGDDSIVAVDQETAAVARIANTRGIPFIAFRALSDSSADGGGGDPLMLPGYPVTFFVYAQLAADNAAGAVIEFVSRLRGPRCGPRDPSLAPLRRCSH